MQNPQKVPANSASRYHSGRYLAAFLLLAWALLTLPAAASAQIAHKFLPGVSEQISEGVPASAPAPDLTGSFSEVNGMTVDEGHLWVAEQVPVERTRVDEFNMATGVWEGQLAQVPSLGILKRGVAVGHVTGEREVYAASGTAIGVFGESGALQAEWTGLAEGEAQVRGVAVDNFTNPLTDWAVGDVYISSGVEGGAANVVDVFKPSAKGVQPAKPVAQLFGTCATVGTSCDEAEQKEHAFVNPGTLTVSASNGDVYVVDNRSVVDVFEPAGLDKFVFVRQISEPVSALERITAVAVDGTTGDLYVATPFAVAEFNTGGDLVATLTETPAHGETPAQSFASVESVAVDSATHDLYVGDHHSEAPGTIDVFSGDVVIPDITTLPPTAISATSATFNGAVDPHGAGPASCQFVWGETTAFGNTTACPEVPEGAIAVPVQKTLTGLSSGTEYCYRLQAGNTNGLNEGLPGEYQCFLTLGAAIPKESVSNVAATSATLEATVNPRERSTSFYFEYGKTTAYEAELPAAPGIVIGAGGEGVEVPVQHAQGLAPNTPYHYRVVAVREGESFPGPDQTFTTQAVGSTVPLPDGRQYELVSPPDKQGAVIESLEAEGAIRASSSGAAMTYIAKSPTEAGVKGSSEAVQVLSARGVGGWSSQDIALPHGSAVGATLGHGPEYRLVSGDLSEALVEPDGEFTSLAPEVSPADTERTPYLRNNSTCEATPGTCFTPLVTGAAGFADVPVGTVFGGSRPGIGAVEVVGASEDLEHVIIETEVALTKTPTTPGQKALYEWSAGVPADRALQPVSTTTGSVLEQGQLGAFNPYTFNGDTQSAVSSDGSRVFWSPANGHELYLRDLSRGESLRLDTVQSGKGSGTEQPFYQAANPDGSVVMFTDQQRLTAGSGPGDLYECAIELQAGKDACALTDLTPGMQGAHVNGLLLGYSTDLSTVYFDASGVLSSIPNYRGEAPGTSGLYELHRNIATDNWEAPVFIANLSGGEGNDWGGRQSRPSEHTARVSPDGRFVVFMSERSLTGYDNRDASSGHPDEEVYLYDSATGRLSCVSCDPTGARPNGVPFSEMENGPAGGNLLWNVNTWLAANVPAWTLHEAGQAFFQSRYLSDSGRVFFDAHDALVPQDINNTEDVYEFEPPGVGSCTTTSQGYAPSNGGCVSLITSGTASAESGFLDANENGDDVFFITGEKLAPQDVDSSLDVYDAHVCSAEAPCPPVLSPPPACDTADSCRTAPSPQPSIFGSPASSTFSGPGNGTAAAAVKAKAKPLTRAQRLAVALKACRKKAKGKQPACERKARKQFGPPKRRKRA